MLKLQFKDRRREAVWLVDQVFTIGKDPSNSLMVDHPGIANFHAELVNQGSSLLLRNKADGLGLWVNEIPVSDETEVKAGDQITLAELQLELIDPKAAPQQEAPVRTRTEWSLSSNASWLEQKHYEVEEKVIIGRDSACDIVLPLEHLSRQHVALEVRKGQLYAIDLESANGTYLNGERIQESVLKSGDKLKIDVVTFVINGPTHDPNKTIIRKVSNPAKTKLKQDSAASKAPQDQPSKPSREIPPASKAASNRGNSNGKVERKRLASEGKQDWISEEPKIISEESNKSSLILTISGAILIAACVVYILSRGL